MGKTLLYQLKVSCLLQTTQQKDLEPKSHKHHYTCCISHNRRFAVKKGINKFINHIFSFLFLFIRFHRRILSLILLICIKLSIIKKDLN